MISLHKEYQKSYIVKEKKIHTGMDSILHKIIGLLYKKYILSKGFRKKAQKIYESSLRLSDISEDELDDNLEKYRKLIRFNKADENIINESLAYISEASSRVLGIRPYDVQLMGVLAQQQSFAIEMLPGEGKTVTSALAGVLAAWTGQPCHIVTSNDYLASRDAKEMEPLYNRCKVKVGYVVGLMQEEERRENYRANIIYATSKELLADFLRDSMKDSLNNYDAYLINKIARKNIDNQKVMYGIHTVIVDEADSVLADEAITPLIISVPTDNDVLKNATIVSLEISKKFILNSDYTVDKKLKQIILTQEGEELITSKYKLLPAVWQEKTRREFLLKQALSAKYFYHKNIDYIIDDEDKIVLVDEKTGRMMEGHSWGAGLQQAVEAKEEIEISPPTHTYMKMSFQRYFRQYSKISGMSGTLQNMDNELWHIYKLPTMKIPKRVKNTYQLLEPEIYFNKTEKIQAIINNIKKINKTQRPILVGMKDIKESEELAQLLVGLNIECTVLNALKHEEEEQIVSEAGALGRITIATNMAGRGTDIKISKEVEKMGGLHVIATQKFSSYRVDLQLYGRTARQGQQGSVQRIFSFEDELFEHFSKNLFIKTIMRNIHLKWSKKVFMLTYKLIQLLIEKKATQIRKQILEKDFSTNEMLSFSANDR